MPYVLDTRDGVFLGCFLGLAFTVGTDTVGQDTACTFETSAEAWKVAVEMNELAPAIAPFRPVEVKSGHWRDLQAAGLETRDMAQNELRAMPVEGAA